MEPALRLFHGYDEQDLGESAPFVIARLLEDGDSADLARLFHRISEAEAVAWLERRGGRQLSFRSRAFWEVVLGRKAGGTNPEVRSLWPL